MFWKSTCFKIYALSSGYFIETRQLYYLWTENLIWQAFIKIYIFWLLFLSIITKEKVAFNKLVYFCRVFSYPRRQYEMETLPI